MEAAYVFRVRFRLEPRGVRVDPQEFETVLGKPAPEPGEDGWLFFRDVLWRGEVGDETHVRSLAEGWLDVPVTRVAFSEFETDSAYREALEDEIEADLEPFNADSVTEVLHKYFGSSIRVTD
ncbi:MAG: LWR-salt protein [Haloferacaceae archaeon]